MRYPHPLGRQLALVSLLLLGLLGCSGDSGGRAPTVSLTASPEVITVGASAELSWQVSGSEPISLTLSPDLAGVELLSPLTVFPTETTSYTLTATNAQGSASSQVTVRVVDTPTIASFQASPPAGTAPLEIEFTWAVAADGALACSLDTGDGAALLEFSDCTDSQTANYTYSQPGTYTARLALASGASRDISITVSEAPAADEVSVGGFIDEQSRNVIIILTGAGSKQVDGLGRLNTAIAHVEASRGVQSSAPAVRGSNAAVLSLLAGQQSQLPQTTVSQATLVDLAREVVVAVTAQGEVVATSPLERPQNSSQLRFNLNVPVEEDVALLIAEADPAGGWICKGTLEYQTLDGQQTNNSEQAIYRFPASLLNDSEALQAGRFQFNELTAELASRLTADTSSVQDDLPSAAVQAATIAFEDAPDFADGLYQLCNNPRAQQAEVLAQLDLTSSQTDDAALYDFAMALLLEPIASTPNDESEPVLSNQLVGTASIDADGNISMSVVRNGSQSREAGLFITDVAFFDARKQSFPLTPTYQFDASASFGVVSSQANQQDVPEVINLGIVSAGLASVRGQVLDSAGNPVPGASVIIVLDGERVSFNVAIADENGFYELLVPVDTTAAYILYAESPDGSVAGLASNDDTGVRFEVEEAGVLNQDIILDVPLPTEPQLPSARPSVSAGEDIATTVGTPVTLLGQASDPDGDSLVLTWQVLEQPTGSSINLTTLTGVTTSFTPEVVGTYQLRLSAFDGQNLAADVVLVEVTASPVASLPVVNLGPLPALTELLEGAAAVQLELTRTGNLDNALTVQLTRSSSSTANPDDLELTGASLTADGYSATFEVGDAQLSFELRALEDDSTEDPELLILNLQASVNYRLGNTTEASFIVLDADPDGVDTTCEGDFEVLARADLDALTDCRTITGSLTVRATDLTGLTELSNLTSIGGALQVLGTNLENLEGLENLVAIGGDLELGANPSLVSLVGLNALSSIGGSVYIGVGSAGDAAENTLLADIRTVAEVSISGDTRVISNNPALDCPAQELSFEVTASESNLVNCLDDPLEPASIDMFSATLQVIEAGGSSLLMWTVSGTPAPSLSLTATDALGATTVSDLTGQNSLSVSPASTTTYSLRAENDAGEDSAELTVTVIIDSPCEDDYVVTSTAELAALQNCETITGRLEITGVDSTDLSLLARLTTLGGDFVINANDTLSSLSGLEALESIAGNLTITANSALSSLTALSNLESLGGSLVITDNPSLPNLAAFPRLRTIGSGVVISDNSGLSNLQGLDEVTLIQGDLEIAGNDMLANLSGLDNLASLGGSLYIGYDDSSDSINGNPLLTDLSALAALTDGLIGGEERIITGNTSLSCPAQELQFGVSVSEGNLEDCIPTICIGDVTASSQADVTALNICAEITGSLQIGADDVTDLDALTGLARIGGDLQIGYLEGTDAIANPQLSSLAGLANLTELEGDLVVRDNPLLTTLTGLEGIDTLLGGLELTNNALLAGLDGLNLTRITGDLSIVGNDELSSLTELATLTDADMLGATTISDNRRLDCLAQNLQFTVDSSTGNQTNCNDLVLEVCDGSFNITTAAQLAGFEVCLEITGDLTIGPSADIINLAPLSNLSTVGVSLRIEGNSALETLSGLRNVSTVGGDIRIINNPLLADTSSLQLITTVATLTIDDNDSLSDLDGLQAMTELANLNINNNLDLLSLDGLDNLDLVTGDITIQDNANLASLAAIANLPDANVGGLVDISANGSLNCPAQSLQFFVDSSGDNLVDCGICSDPAGFTVTNASELNALALCRIVDSDLTLLGSSDIVSLAPLANLERINGSLNIDSNTALTTLDGLEGVDAITGDISLSNNAALSTLDALGTLPTNIDPLASITVTGNALLTSLDGLQGTASLDSLQLTSTALTDLTGLDNLLSVNNDVALVNNPALTDLSALAGLNTISNDLTISGNSALTDLSGLGGLLLVGNDVDLGNNSLTSLAGLTSLATVNGDLNVSSNPNLETLLGFTPLSTVGGDITISNNDNPLFTSLDGLDGISSYDDAANTVTVSDNDNLDCLLPPALPFVVDVSTGNDVNCTRVCTGPRTVSSQADLINLGAELCREITGDLVITGSTDIFTLALLGELQVIGGNLVITDNGPLANLNGLDALQTVGGNLELTNNNALASLAALANQPMSLTASSELIVRGNTNLNNLDGLQGTTTLGRLQLGDASILNNNLQMLTGLNNLETVTGDVELLNNALLNDVSALASLMSITGDFDVMNNAPLTNFGGMTSLGSVGGDVQFANNGLTSLAGLSGLTTIGNALTIADNANLASLADLSNLASLGGNLTVDNNDNASFTSLLGLDNIGSYNDGNTVTIQDNDNLDCSLTPALPFMVDISSGNAVNCTMTCMGNQVANNQTEVDGLALCREIIGNLTINGTMTTLAPLINLENLTGNLSITVNPFLPDIDGLDNLATIGGNLQVAGNGPLANLNALATTPTSFSATTQIDIAGNGLLNDLSGLIGVTSAQSIFISNNTFLTTLAGLDNLGSVSGNLEITFSGALSDVSALSNLGNVGGNVQFTNHSALTNFTGLGNLTTIGGDLAIEANTSVATLAGFDGLLSVGDEVIIDNNGDLTSLAALTNLTTVNGDITINDNGSVGFNSLNGIQNIAGYDDPANAVTITNNPNLDCSLVQPLPFEVDSSVGNSVDCVPAPCIGNRTANSQAQLDALSLCSEIDGDLTIANSTDIFDLDSLINLTTLDGALDIDNNTALMDISGLSNLTSFGGDNLRISNNDVLVSLVGLEGIGAVTNFDIVNNPLLPNLDGLDNLTTVTGIFSIQTNPELETFIALGSLTTVAGDITISDNIDILLTSLDGLQNIFAYDDVANTVTLTGNTNLDCGAVTPPFIVDVQGGNATFCPM